MPTLIPRLALGVLVLLAPLRPAISGQELLYTIEVPDPHARTVRVSVDLPKGASALRMDYFGANHLPEKWATFVRDLKASDGEGNPVSLVQTASARWKLEGGPRAPIRIAYDLSLTHREVNWPFGIDEAAYDAPEGLFFVGRSLFITPVEDAPARTIFLIPQGWRASTAWAPVANEPGVYRVDHLQDLVNSCLQLGTQFEEALQLQSATIIVALGGNLREQEPNVRRLIETSLRSFSGLFGGTPDSRFVVILNPGAGAIWNGGAYRRGLSVLTPDHVTDLFQSPTGVNTISHEIFHLWNGYAMEPREQADWFKEGFTDYYSLVLLRKNGFINETRLLYDLSNHLTRYENARSKVTIAGAGEEATRNKDMIYDGGASAALAMDLLLRRQTNGQKSLDDLMKALYERTRPGGPLERGYTTADIESLAGTIGGTSYRDFFERYIRGRDQLPIAELLKGTGIQFETQTLAGRPRVTLKLAENSIKPSDPPAVGFLRR